MVSIMFSLFGGIVFGFMSSAGAAVALWVVDSHLKRSRVVQGIIAGIGAVLPGVGLLAILGQTASIDFSGTLALLIYVFASAFALMVMRSTDHRA